MSHSDKGEGAVQTGHPQTSLPYAAPNKECSTPDGEVQTSMGLETTATCF